VCPVCTTRLRQSCRNCKQPLEALWQVCPYCETPVEPSAVEPLGQTQALTPPTRRERSA
jgi:predicted amidophosphoribosyltransferase